VLHRKLIQLIKRTFTTVAQDDSNSTPLVNVSAFDNETISEVIYPYGLFSIAPAKCQSLTFNVLAQENNQASILYNNLTRPKNLKVGDVWVGCPTSSSYTLYQNDGGLEVITSKSSIVIDTDGTITIKGDNLVLDGNVNITGSFAIQGNNLPASHKHGGVQTGSGETGTPIA